MPAITESIQDYFIFKRAQRLSETTLKDYEGILDKFAQHIGEEREIETITAKDVSQYLATLNVSKKRIKNVHITLSSLWTWAVQQGICQEHIMRAVNSPRPEKRVISPIERAEVESLIQAAQKTDSNRDYTTIALRNHAIILFLLDTGVRASELCQLRIKDIGATGAYVYGKGAKDRIVPISSATRETINLYLKTRKTKLSDYVFVTEHKGGFSRDTLHQIVTRIAHRAGILKIHPHKFRHTFAINFLRNGGDPFSLQMILGHETLEMVKRYLAIAKSDIQNAHHKASPVKGWSLGLENSSIPTGLFPPRVEENSSEINPYQNHYHN